MSTKKEIEFNDVNEQLPLIKEEVTVKDSSAQKTITAKPFF